MDDKIDGNWQMWPGLLDDYRIAEQHRRPARRLRRADRAALLLVPNADRQTSPP